MLKALLMALLEPTEQLIAYEQSGDFTARLALMEEAKVLPFGAVWDYHCLKSGVPVGMAWLNKVKDYEQSTLLAREAECSAASRQRITPRNTDRLGSTFAGEQPFLLIRCLGGPSWQMTITPQRVNTSANRYPIMP